MLNQFFVDWNAALQSRKVVRENRNSNGIITSQETEFLFRNVKIKMYSHLRPGDEHKPEHQRRWSSELFVPSTNKIVPSALFPTKAKCAAAILSCLVEGRDHEDRLQERVEKRKAIAAERNKKQWKERLLNTSFKDDADFIVDWIAENSVPERSSWNDDLITIISKYDYFITGVGLEHQVTLNETDLKLHQQRMLNTACSLIESSVTDRNGIGILTRRAISKYFLEPREGLSQGVYVVRSAFSKINDMCPLSNKMLYVVRCIAEYLAKVMGTTVFKTIEDLRAYRESKYNRLAERENKGEVAPRTHKHTNKAPKKHNDNVSATRAYSMKNTTPITSMGDMFGDVLDKAVTSAESTPKGKKHKKYAPTTNNQVNGKISADENDRKQKLASEEAKQSVAEQQQHFAEAAMEEEVVVPEKSLAEQQAEFAAAMMAEEKAATNEIVADEPIPVCELVQEDVPEEHVVEVTVCDEEEIVEEKPKKSRKRTKLEDDMDAEDRAVIKKTGKGSKKRTSKAVDIDEL